MNTLINIRLLKYALVGILGMTIDFSVTWTCKERFRFNKYLANSIGFSLAVIGNFLLNRYWTFNQNAGAAEIQFVKFVSVSVAGLVMNNLLLFILLKTAGRNFYFLKLVVIGIVFCWNYLANLLFTFN